jgi:hypothetical protein
LGLFLANDYSIASLLMHALRCRELPEKSSFHRPQTAREKG